MRVPVLKFFAPAVSVFMLSISVAIAADLDDKKPFGLFMKAFDDEARACDDAKITKSIKKRFHHQAKIELGNDGLEIESITGMHQHRAYDATETQQIARRYCGATAYFNNGQRRDVWYIIESRMGFTSIDDGVTYCVSGFDGWYVHNGACRVER